MTDPYPPKPVREFGAAPDSLKAASFDRKAPGAHGRGCERPEQLTFDITLGVR